MKMNSFMVSAIAFIAGVKNRLTGDEKGATATEYALLVALIAFGIVVAVGLFGDALAGYFSELSGVVNGWNATGN